MEGSMEPALTKEARALELLRTAVREVTGKTLSDRVGLETSISNMGFDSFEFAQIVTHIEESFPLPVELPTSRWFSARTVGELVNTIVLAIPEP